MPILWRYVLYHFIKTLVISILTFVLVLITLRMDEIAHFSTLGPASSVILKYTLYQIPYILPIAIPISCLISALLLMNKMSESHELTAIRSFGVSIFSCLAPILIFSLSIALLNFWIVSEMGTACHLGCTRLKAELRLVNPLLLMNHKHLMRMKGLYFDSFGSSKLGETAEDAIFAYPEKRSGKIALLVAKKLSIKEDLFFGNDVTLIGSVKEKKNSGAPLLAIENIGQYSVPVKDFALMMENKTWSINLDYLRLPLLLVQREREKAALLESSGESEAKVNRRALSRIDIEIIRRVSVGFAAFSFTFLGLSFGMGFSRGRKIGSIFKIVCLSSLFLICYFAAKGVDHQFITAILLYTLPHVLILLFSFLRIIKLERGKV